MFYLHHCNFQLLSEKAGGLSKDFFFAQTHEKLFSFYFSFFYSPGIDNVISLDFDRKISLLFGWVVN